MTPMRIPHLLGALAAIAMSTAAIDRSLATSPGATDATQTALYEGNRLFRDGQIEAAVAAYLEGYSPRAPHPTLFYNLGTALHHLDRLPEAILWYRRAARAGDPSGLGRRLGEGPSRTPGATPGLWRAGDPWLAENLWLARRSLGSQVLRPAGLPGRLDGTTGSARIVAIAIAWITLLLVVARAEVPAWTVAAAAALAISIYGGAAALDRWGPQPAVLLQDCPTATGELPAGTEVWVRPGAGDWRISGSGNRTCPAGAVELIRPR